MTPARTRRRPGRPRGGLIVADREAVLDAAERVIRRCGPGVSIDAIAEEAGVTKPIVYRSVGGKDALVTALGERLDRRVSSAIDAAVGTPGGSGRDEVRTFVRASLEAVAADRDLYLFVSAGGTGEDRLSQALQLADRTAVPLAQRLAARRAADGADPAVAEPWAYGVVGMMHFVTLWWLRAPTTSADELAEQLTDLLWKGLRP